MVRGALVSLLGTGQTVRVLVFAKGEGARGPRAGADFAGSDDMVARSMKDSWISIA